ncbi:unnamed protein product [Periconia digitata]|uniref:Uncharacterized protein n=1 Tax=Periconia digitata TaxID=1303443 RepID=A0A9W4UCF1_9PLEO|nr:unnamed protein product [Periconia digitata]
MRIINSFFTFVTASVIAFPAFQTAPHQVVLPTRQVTASQASSFESYVNGIKTEIKRNTSPDEASSVDAAFDSVVAYIDRLKSRDDSEDDEPTPDKISFISSIKGLNVKRVAADDEALPVDQAAQFVSYIGGLKAKVRRIASPQEAVFMVTAFDNVVDYTKRAYKTD